MAADHAADWAEIASAGSAEREPSRTGITWDRMGGHLREQLREPSRIGIRGAMGRTSGSTAASAIGPDQMAGRV